MLPALSSLQQLAMASEKSGLVDMLELCKVPSALADLVIEKAYESTEDNAFTFPTIHPFISRLPDDAWQGLELEVCSNMFSLCEYLCLIGPIYALFFALFMLYFWAIYALFLGNLCLILRPIYALFLGR